MYKMQNLTPPISFIFDTKLVLGTLNTNPNFFRPSYHTCPAAVSRKSKNSTFHIALEQVCFEQFGCVLAHFIGWGFYWMVIIRKSRFWLVWAMIWPCEIAKIAKNGQKQSKITILDMLLSLNRNSELNVGYRIFLLLPSPKWSTKKLFLFVSIQQFFAITYVTSENRKFCLYLDNSFWAL